MPITTDLLSYGIPRCCGDESDGDDEDVCNNSVGSEKQTKQNKTKQKSQQEGHNDKSDNFDQNSCSLLTNFVLQ